MRNITGRVYRVKGVYNAWFVEVDAGEKPIEALSKFCAEKALKGYPITSVTELVPDSNTSPRVAVLSTKEFKKALALAQREESKKKEPTILLETTAHKDLQRAAVKAILQVISDAGFRITPY